MSDVVESRTFTKIGAVNPNSSMIGKIQTQLSNNKLIGESTFMNPTSSKKSQIPFKNSSFVKSGAMGTISQVGGAALQDMGSLFGAEPPGADTGIENQKSISSMAKQFGPWGQVAGLAMDAMMGLESALGVTQNTIDNNQAKRAGVRGFAKGLNNLTASIPGLGWVAALTSGKTNTAEKGMNVENVRSSYGGTLQDLDASESMSGKNYMFGTKKMNQFIDEMNRKNRILEDIASTNTLRKQSQYGNDLAQQNLNRYTGNNYSDLRAAKHGMKLPSIDEVQLIIERIHKMQNGGKMNIIPDGALHAHRHHLEELDSSFEDVTSKGIPVITDSGEQIAEIEKEEIIFSLEITKQLEELAKNGSDEAAIEAGKLLVEEILFNTEDRTGLLNKD